MRPTSQELFRRRVKIWLVHQNMTVTELAQKIGRRRDTVSTAIHSKRFPKVRTQIAKEIQ
jgi:transposase